MLKLKLRVKQTCKYKERILYFLDKNELNLIFTLLIFLHATPSLFFHCEGLG